MKGNPTAPTTRHSASGKPDKARHAGQRTVSEARRKAAEDNDPVQEVIDSMVNQVKQAAQSVEGATREDTGHRGARK